MELIEIQEEILKQVQLLASQQNLKSRIRQHLQLVYPRLPKVNQENLIRNRFHHLIDEVTEIISRQAICQVVKPENLTSAITLQIEWQLQELNKIYKEIRS